MKWGDNARDFDRPLAVWPHYRPLFDNWLMQELVEQGDRAPVWRDRRVPSENGRVRGDVYSDRETARSAAATLNQTAAELAWKAGCRGIPRNQCLVSVVLWSCTHGAGGGFMRSSSEAFPLKRPSPQHP